MQAVSQNFEKEGVSMSMKCNCCRIAACGLIQVDNQWLCAECINKLVSSIREELHTSQSRYSMAKTERDDAKKEIERLKKNQGDGRDNICGPCGKPDADKMAQLSNEERKAFLRSI